MSGIATIAAAVAEHLERLGSPFALVGGLAVSVQTEPRFTRDIDLAVAVADDAAAEQAVRSFLDDGYLITTVLEHDGTGRLATVRLTHASGVLVDLLFASSGIEAELTQAAEQLEVLPGLVLPVASIGHLIALKLLSRDDASRPQDFGDLRALIEAASAEDLIEAEQAISLITDRGFDRGRDLDQALARART